MNSAIDPSGVYKSESEGVIDTLDIRSDGTARHNFRVIRTELELPAVDVKWRLEGNTVFIKTWADELDYKVEPNGDLIRVHDGERYIKQN